MKPGFLVYCQRCTQGLGQPSVLSLYRYLLAVLAPLLIFAPASAEEKGFWERTTIGKFLSGDEKKDTSNKAAKTIYSKAEDISYKIDPVTKRFATYMVKGKSFKFHFPDGLCANAKNAFITPGMQKKVDQKAKENGLEAGITLHMCPGEKGTQPALVNTNFYYQKPPLILVPLLKKAETSSAAKKTIIEAYRTEQHRTYQAELDQMMNGPFGKGLVKKIEKETGLPASFKISVIKELPLHDNGFYTGAQQNLKMGSHKFLSYMVMSNFFMDGEFYRLNIAGRPGKPLNEVLKIAQNMTKNILAQSDTASPSPVTTAPQTKPAKIAQKSQKPKSALESYLEKVRQDDRSKKEITKPKTPVARPAAPTRNIASSSLSGQTIRLNIPGENISFTVPPEMCKRTLKKPRTFKKRVEVLIFITCSDTSGRLDLSRSLKLLREGRPTPPIYANVQFYSNPDKSPQNFSRSEAEKFLNSRRGGLKRAKEKFSGAEHLAAKQRGLEKFQSNLRGKISTLNLSNIGVLKQTKTELHTVTSFQIQADGKLYVQHNIASFLYRHGKVLRIYSYFPATRTFSLHPFETYHQQFINQFSN